MDSVLQNLQSLQIALKTTPIEPTALSASQWQQLCDAHILTLENQLILLNRLFENASSDAENLRAMHNGTSALLQDALQFRGRLFDSPAGHTQVRRERTHSRLRDRVRQKAASFSFVEKTSKRKEIDGEVFAVTPSNKRRRSGDGDGCEDDAETRPSLASQAPIIEFEDLTEEVDRRLREKAEARRKEAQRLASGTMRKRGRRSFEKAQNVDAAHERSTSPRASKKRKRIHSSLSEENQGSSNQSGQRRSKSKAADFRSLGGTAVTVQ